ncbi:MAG TPA: GNAT family N-acetyltransferase [Bryobacteraceae bacterium]|nr:GNAT family N-acetyltransferase [Bryobacteraceae bacterium]
MHEFHSVEANLRAAMRFFGEATGRGDIQHLDGAVGIYAGLDYGVFNIALLERNAPERDGPERAALTADLEHTLDACGAYFAARTPRWSFWLCEDLLDRHERRHTRRAFEARGMRMISNPPGMYASALLPPAHRLPEVECCPAGDARTTDAFARITAVNFDIPEAIAQAVYRPERAWAGTYRGYVGFVKGRAVSIVAIVAAESVLGVYSLSTLPEFRRRGYGQALLREALSREHQHTGLEHIVLQSTDAGYSLYRRLGFREVTRFSVWLTK